MSETNRTVYCRVTSRSGAVLYEGYPQPGEYFTFDENAFLRFYEGPETHLLLEDRPTPEKPPIEP